MLTFLPALRLTMPSPYNCAVLVPAVMSMTAVKRETPGLLQHPQAKACCPRNGKASAAFMRQPSFITTVHFAWEGGKVGLASPDTGQDRWKQAHCAWLSFNPARGEAGRLSAHNKLHDHNP
jgi:hypothetical protein